MADSKGSDKDGARAPGVWPSRTAPSDLPSFSDAPSDAPLSDDDRKARFKRRIVTDTREARARVRRRKDFEADLIRGKRVTHRLHLIVMTFLAGVALAASRAPALGGVLLLVGLLVFGGYGLFWYFLTVTGGEEREHISIDEMGVITSVKSGHDIERRGDVLRVAIPIAVVVASGWVTVGLVRDVVMPPQPNCNATADDPPGACVKIPNPFALMHATANVSNVPASHPAARTAVPSDSQTVAPEPSATPDPSAAASAAAKGGTLNVEETQALERIIRVMQLVFSVGFFLISAWFLRRMLTGRWVGFIRPVHHKLSDG